MPSIKTGSDQLHHRLGRVYRSPRPVLFPSSKTGPDTVPPEAEPRAPGPTPGRRFSIARPGGGRAPLSTGEDVSSELHRAV